MGTHGRTGLSYMPIAGVLPRGLPGRRLTRQEGWTFLLFCVFYVGGLVVLRAEGRGHRYPQNEGDTPWQSRE